MKLSEIIKKGVVKFDTAESLKGHVFIKGKPTTCMQARVMLPQESGQGCGIANTLFQFGIDIYPKIDLVLTTCEHKWHYTVLGLLEEMARAGRLDAGYGVIVCDDPCDDIEENVDMRFLQGVEELEYDNTTF